MEPLHLPRESLFPCELVDNTPPLLDLLPSPLSSHYGHGLDMDGSGPELCSM